MASARSSFRAKILIADDSRFQRLMLNETLMTQGFDVILASDGLEAVELFLKEQPDLVILDIRMPNMDGIEAGRRIQADIRGRYVPIVFVSEATSDENLQKCLDIGADDFIPKPFQPVMLTAKINSLLRTKALFEEQRQQKEALLDYRHHMEREQEVASNLYKKIIHTGFKETPILKYMVSPMALFNGDILLSAMTPAGNLHIMLGDFTGHGLSASIAVGPTAEIFYGMTKKGFGMQEIMAEINRKLLEILPLDIFFAATMVSLEPQSKTMSICAGGLPDHLLYNTETDECRVISSANFPLGIVNRDQSEFNIQTYDVTQHDKLYLFTDGVIEARNRQDQEFGMEGVSNSIRQSRDSEMSSFEEIKNSLERFLDGMEQQDDTTLAELRCDMAAIEDRSESMAKHQQKIEAMQWKSVMEFHASTLKRINPVPMLIHSVMEIQGLQQYREAIFVIVTELFSNALEHGLLLLDSEIKSSPDGFKQYFNLREERLRTLEEGFIKVSFRHRPIKNGGCLYISVQDSGSGFDLNKVQYGLDKNEQYAGRGIGLLEELCHSVKYAGNGNRVKAIYKWSM